MTTANQNANWGGSGEWALMRWRFTPIPVASASPRQANRTKLPLFCVHALDAPNTPTVCSKWAMFAVRHCSL